MGAISEGSKVAIFGAGGPVGAAAGRALGDHYTLRLTDLRSIAEIVAENKPQSPGAPLPELLTAPHECRTVDVTDYEQVREAARGMDALINATVLREKLKPAFEVSMIGAYHVAKAAVEHGIRRVIHTGPQHLFMYEDDFDVPADAPVRPKSDLYAVSKYLGGEIMRVFAERHGIEVLNFLFCGFLPDDVDARSRGQARSAARGGPFVTSWGDTGQAFLYGLRAPALPRPYEQFFICADLPRSRFSPAKAKRLLGWEARQRFEHLWTREAVGTGDKE